MTPPIIPSPSPPSPDAPIKPSEIAARCHEIQTGLGMVEVPEFENLRMVGMAVRVALHIRGLPNTNYDTLRLVSTHLLGIPAVALRPILELLADVEFVKLQTDGKTIRTVLPQVPYYETLYDALGGYAVRNGFNEAEELSIKLLCRLSKSPENIDSLSNQVGAERRLIDRAFDIGKQGAYFRMHRSRGRNIALSPTYFSENAEIYADMVAGGGAIQVKRVLSAIKSLQGVPLSIVQKTKEVAGVKLSDDEINLLIRLAQDGAVKPPSISTAHSGEQFFLFTPTPSGAVLAPTKRDIYERAMAIVAAVRQGQFLPQQYAIRYPAALINKLRTSMKLGRATTEATHQYQKLVQYRVARLVNVGGGFSELQIIDTEENREALEIAYNLVAAGVSTGTEVDESARKALQQEHSFVESLVAAGNLQRRFNITVTAEQQLEIENLFLK